MELIQDQATLIQITDLVKYAFLKQGDLITDVNFLGRYNHSFNFGEYKNDKLASYIMVNKFISQVFDKKLKMGGVGYVSSYPENRGQGDINRLMKEIITFLYQNDYAISNLAPFSESFYRRYGYENTIYQKELAFKNEALNNFRPVKQGEVIRGRLTDPKLMATVKELYQNKLKQNSQRNTVVREKWWWERFNTYYPERFTCVYIDENGKAQGYMFYEINDTTFDVGEFYYQTPQAAEALLSIVASHASNDLQYRMNLPETTLLNEFFANQALLKLRTLPYMMTRIINLKQVLEAIPLLKAGNLIIEVTNDDIIKENNGIWKITNTNNKNFVEKSSARPEYRGSLTNWTKVLLGHLTLKQAVELNYIQTDQSGSNDFVKGEVSFYDYF